MVVSHTAAELETMITIPRSLSGPTESCFTISATTSRIRLNVPVRFKETTKSKRSKECGFPLLSIVYKVAGPLPISRCEVTVERKYLCGRSDASRIYDASQSCLSAADPFDYGLNSQLHFCRVGQVCLEEADLRAAGGLDILWDVLQV